MSSSEDNRPQSPFTLVERTLFPATRHEVYSDYENSLSGHGLDLDVQLTAALRAQYPNHILTTVPTGNCNLMYFAASGQASAKLDIENETVLRVRGFVRASGRSKTGELAEGIRFAKYDYVWLREKFIVYYVQIGFSSLQYILKEAENGESIRGHSSKTDTLLKAIGVWQIPNNDVICK